MPTTKEICAETLALNNCYFGKSKGSKGTEILYIPTARIRGHFPQLGDYNFSKQKREEVILKFLKEVEDIKGRWWIEFQAKGRFGRETERDILSITTEIYKAKVSTLNQMISDGYHTITVNEEDRIQKIVMKISQFNTSEESQLAFIVKVQELLGYEAIDFWQQDFIPFDTKAHKVKDIIHFAESGASHNDGFFNYSDGQYTRFYGEDSAIHPDHLEKIDGRIYEDDEVGTAIESFWRDEDCNVDYLSSLDKNDEVVVFHRKGKDWYISPAVKEEEIEYAFWDSEYKKLEIDSSHIDFANMRNPELIESIALTIKDYVNDTKKEAEMNLVLSEDEKNGILDMLDMDICEAKEMFYNHTQELESYSDTWQRVKTAAIEVDKYIVTILSTRQTYRHLHKLSRLVKIIGGEITKSKVSGSLIESYCIKYEDEEYHFDVLEFISSVEREEQTPREFLQLVMKAIEKRKKNPSKDVFKYADRVFVSVEDSIESGNCKLGTLNIARELGINLNKTGGIRGDVLLSLSNDMFTQRAIQVAIDKIIKKEEITNE